jgi:hypothetical protein
MVLKTTVLTTTKEYQQEMLHLLNRVAIGFGYNNTPEWTIKYSSYHTHAFFTGNDWGSSTEKLRITSAGNVGIGTTTPANKLEVDGGSSAVTLRVSTTNTSNGVSALILSNSSKSAFNDGMKMAHGGGFTNITDLNGTNIMSWDMSNTRVGIGTVTPAYKLDVIGSARIGQTSNNSTSTSLQITSGGNGYDAFIDFGYWDTFDAGIWYVGRKGSTGAFFISDYSGGPELNRLTITTSGNVGIGLTNPSYKLDVTGKIYSNTEVQGGTAIMNDTGGITVFGSNTSTRSIRVGRNGTLNDIFITGSSGNVGIGTINPAQRLHVSGNIAQTLGTATTTHFVGITGSLTTNTVVASLDVATQPAYGVFFDYVVYDDAEPPTNARAGTIMTVNNNSTSRYTDTSTSDIGDTTPVDFSTSISGNNLLLTANIASGTWYVRLNYRRF